MENFKEKLKVNLLPLYNELISANTFQNICVFCVQWGENFPKNENTGILFVGKAVNGWINNNTDINIIFGDTNNKIFARNDQMEWVHNLEKNNKIYNTNKSSFWRVVKKISQNFYPKDEWFSYVAWSNLCKIAPFEGGNPNNNLYYEQLKYNQKILRKEIEILSPRFVVMLTSDWEKDFMFYLNENKHTKSEKKIIWDGYETKLVKINEINYIISKHPQGKDETKHVKAIINLIEKNIKL